MMPARGGPARWRFVRLGHDNLVVRLPTIEERVTRAKKKKGSVWLTPENAPVATLTSASYCHYVLAELAKAEGKVGARRRRSPRHPVRLVHDRDPAHTSQETATFAASHGIELIELSARSADLDPLDYGVFGAVKQEWRRRVQQGQLGWEGRCGLLVQLLKQADASAVIQALPGRIQKCIAAKGGHFKG